MAAEILYEATVEQRRPNHFVRGLAAVVLVSVAPLVSDRLSTLISCWAWVQSLYVTFAHHIQDDISDHDQVRVFLVGVCLSGYFSLLMRFLISECRSFLGFIAVAAGTLVAGSLPVIAFNIWEMLGYKDHYYLYYAAQLLLFRLNAVTRFVAESRLGMRALVHNPRARVRSQNAYYEYASLARNQIRVLRLLPGPSSEPIRCQLDVVSLDGDVAYQAVSYVWGSNELSHFVIVERDNNNNDDNEGARLDVTASAHAVLTRLRSRWRERVLWIDGLCIDQEDEDEKSSQVQMMGRVYTGARRVVAYLGPSETAPLVQSHLARIRYLRQFRAMSIEQIRDAMLDSAPGWLAICHFFNNPWFTRVWVVEEVVLSAELHLLYGNICMDWGAISQSMDVILDPTIRPLLLWGIHPDPGLRTSVLGGVDGASAMLDLYGDFETRPSLMTLGAVLEWSLCFNCGDKRDKIYGLLSLVEDPGVTPNYSADYREVYCSAMRQIIWADGAIGALHFAGNGSREPVAGLPSWVSDWQYSSYNGLYNREYTAGTDHPSSVLVDRERPLCVSVKGWRRDRVKLLSDALEMGDEASVLERNRIMRAWHRAAETMAMRNAIYYPKSKRLEVYIRTTIADRPPSEDSTAFTGAKCMEMYESLHQCGSGLDQEILGILIRLPLALLELCKDTLERYDQLGMAMSEFLALSQHLFRNRFCVTEHGRTAVVPPRAREGDIISILGGAGMPFLLRPQGESFELIGCCYVYGLMGRGEVDGPGEYFDMV